MASGTAPMIGSGGIPPVTAPPTASESLIDKRVQRTRRQVQSVDVAVGLMTLAVGMLLFLLLTAVLDHWVVTGGLGFAGRMWSWALLVGGAGAYFLWRVLPALVHRINPVWAAQAIEQKQPSFKNSLINLLLLRHHRQEVRPEIYQALERQAAADLHHLPTDVAVDHTRVTRASWVLAGVFGLIALYLFFSHKSPLVSFERILMPWSDTPAPTRVSVDKIEPGDTDAFHGDTLAVSANVSGLGRDEGVTLYYTTADGQIVDAGVPMTQVDDGIQWKCTMPPGDLGLQQDLTYRLVAGDCRSRSFAVHVQVNPTITVERVEYHYPDYTGLPVRVAEREGDLRALEGTEVTIHARANEQIGRAEMDLNCTGGPGVLMSAREDRATGKLLLRMKPDDRSQPEFTSYQLRFEDQLKRPNRQPIRHRIDIIADEAPEVQLLYPEAPELGLAPSEPLEMRVRAKDPDFALRRVVLHAEVKGQPLPLPALLEKRPPEAPYKGEFVATYRFVADKLGLKVGDEVTYWAAADDNKTDAQGEWAPNHTETNKRQLVIIDPKASEGKIARQAGQPGAQGDNPAPTNGPRNTERGDGKSDEKNPQNAANDPKQPKTADEKQAAEHTKPGEKKDNPASKDEMAQTKDQAGQAGQSGDPKDNAGGDGKAQSGGKSQEGKTESAANAGSPGFKQDDKGDKEMASADAGGPQSPPKVDLSSPGDVIARMKEYLEEQKQKQAGQSGDQKPGEQKTGEQKPGEQKSSDQKPGEQKPGEQKPGEQKPGEQKPGEQKPGEQKPGEQKPHDQTNAGQPQPGSQQPGQQQSPQPGQQNPQPGQQSPQPGQQNPQPGQQNQPPAGGNQQQAGAGSPQPQNGAGQNSPDKQAGSGSPQPSDNQNGGGSQQGQTGQNSNGANQPSAQSGSKDGAPQAGNQAGTKTGEKSDQSGGPSPQKNDSAQNGPPNGQPTKGEQSNGKEPGDQHGKQSPAGSNEMVKANPPPNGEPSSSQSHGGSPKPDQAGPPPGAQAKNQSNPAGDAGTAQKSPGTPQGTPGGKQSQNQAPSGQQADNNPGAKGSGGDQTKQASARHTEDAPMPKEPGERSATSNPNTPQPGQGDRTAANGIDEKTPPQADKTKSPAGSQGGDAEHAGGQAREGHATPDKMPAPSAESSHTPHGPQEGKSENSAEVKGDKSTEGKASVKSPKESNTSGGADGERSGKGDPGGGQHENKAGAGSAGSHTASEQGDGKSKEKGQGETGSKAGDQVKSDKPTGQAGQEAGNGSTSQSGSGESAGGQASSAQQPGAPPPSPQTDANKPQDGTTGSGTPGSGPPEGTRGTTPDGDSGNSANGGPENGPVAPGDDPNLEYAAKQFDLALEGIAQQLEKQKGPDRALLDRLGLTREELEGFYRQWQKMKKDAREEGEAGDAARADLRNALRSLGLRQRPTVVRGGHTQQDEMRTLNQARHSAPPAAFAPLVKAYTQGMAEGK